MGDLKQNVKKAEKLPYHVTAPEGTTIFRTINFERYAVRILLLTRMHFRCRSDSRVIFEAISSPAFMEHSEYYGAGAD